MAQGQQGAAEFVAVMLRIAQQLLEFHIMGRLTLYTPELASEILRRISDGESLRAICREEGFPAPSTVRGWVVDDVEGFAEQYMRARALQAEHWAEEILEIADETAFDDKINDKGDIVPDNEYMQRSRLRVDTRKWLLSKVLPKVYGDKLDVTSKGEKVGLVINIEVGDDK